MELSCERTKREWSWKKGELSIKRTKREWIWKRTKTESSGREKNWSRAARELKGS